MSRSRAISRFFFTDCGGGKFSCKPCETAPGSGYMNLISNLATSHLDYSETYDRTMMIFTWMEWVVAWNKALSEVDDPVTCSLAAITGTLHFITVYILFGENGELQQVLSKFLLEKKDTTMILFIVVDNYATSQAIASRRGVPY
ncbi:hypothetical protein L915_22001, partial [Phytophthora nicotianae]